VQKDRVIFAIIIYGLILLAGAGICSVLLPENISAEADAGKEAEKDITSVPDASGPTQPAVPTKQPEQSVNDVHGSGAESDNQNMSETEKTDDKTQNETVSGDEISGENKPEQDVATGAWAQLSTKTTAEWRNIIGERCIVLQKPEMNAPGQELKVLLTEMPVEQSIALRVQGCRYTELGYEAIERIAGEAYFASEPIVAESELIEDPLRKMTWSCTLQEDGSYELYIELLLDQTYVYNVYETETYYFIALKEAKEVYDRIVVLDAGHGGWDTGTLAKDGAVLEKNINLQVLLYLEELLEAENIKVYATRTTDRYIGQGERIALANALEADLFLSIHCSNAGSDAAEGTEVLYTQYQEMISGMNSEKLAQLCLDELAEAVPLSNTGLQAGGDDLTVLQKAEVPAVQVELAFRSNTEAVEGIEAEATQKKVAEALYRAVLQVYETRQVEQ